MKLGFCDGSEDDEHKAVGLVEISKAFAMLDDFVHGEAPPDRV